MQEMNRQPGKLQAWILASRPKTLPAALSPVFVGIGIAINQGGFRLGPALAAMFCAVLLQIGANLTNDVADFESGTDTAERQGPMRVTQAGLLTPRTMWIGVFIVFGVAALVGLYLAIVAGWLVVWLGLASIAAAMLYTVGPFPLVKVGLGDVFVMIFFGFVAVCGTVFIMLGYVPASAWWAAAGVGALTINILVVNNVRDIETDRAAGRRNIPVVFGRSAGIFEYGLMLLVSYVMPVMMLLFGLASWWVLLPLISIPMSWRLLLDLRINSNGPVMNKLLARTAQYLLIYCVLLAVGFSV